LERRVADAAAATGQPFELVECDPALADTAAFCEHYGYSPDISANTIVVASKTEPPQFVACLVLATTRLDVNGTVRRRLGARKVSFAPAEVTAEVTGMVMGGVTVFGLPADVPIWVDAAVVQRPQLIVGGGSRGLKLLVSSAALTALPNVEVVEGLALNPT
jgi:prolyl-tRNA editing enzyme YbaK/EbsC (Cys-tRNA(Pro) deacylase)